MCRIYLVNGFIFCGLHCDRNMQLCSIVRRKHPSVYLGSFVNKSDKSETHAGWTIPTALRGVSSLLPVRMQTLALIDTLSRPVSYSRTDRHILPLLQGAPTASRTATDSIFCLLHPQSSPDLQSGGLHTEYKDYTTVYLYLLESFQNLGTQVDEKGTLGVLKYMLLCNVILNLVSHLCQCCCLRSGTFIGYFFY
jgi:hypothetical protein